MCMAGRHAVTPRLFVTHIQPYAVHRNEKCISFTVVRAQCNFFFFLVHWCIGAWPLDMAQTDFFFITNCIYIVQTADCCTLVSACVCVCVAHSNFTLKLHWICTFFFASQIKWKKMKASQRSRCQFATYYTIQARMGKHTRSNVHNMRLELILYEQLPCASHIYIYICGFLHYIVEWNANDF